MTTRSAIRATIRAELDDTGGTPTWTDANLNEWLNQAIRDFSLALPQEVSLTITAVANQAAYTLPTGLLRITRVEQPQLVIRVPASDHRVALSPPDLGQLVDYQTGLRTATSWTYRVFGGKLVLDPAPQSIGSTQDILLEYLGSYAEPSADGDTLATPPTCDHILVHLAAASALHWITMDEEKRLAFEVRNARPSATSATHYEQLAANEIASRTPPLRSSTLEVL